MPDPRIDDLRPQIGQLTALPGSRALVPSLLPQGAPEFATRGDTP